MRMKASRPDDVLAPYVAFHDGLVLRSRRPGDNFPGRALATPSIEAGLPGTKSGDCGIGFSSLPARNRQAGGAAEMGKLNPPYTLNPSVQPEISGRPTGFARQADAAGIIHPTHTFPSALNYGVPNPVDPLRPLHFRAAAPILRHSA